MVLKIREKLNKRETTNPLTTSWTDHLKTCPNTVHHKITLWTSLASSHWRSLMTISVVSALSSLGLEVFNQMICKVKIPIQQEEPEFLNFVIILKLTRICIKQHFFSMTIFLFHPIKTSFFMARCKHSPQSNVFVGYFSFFPNWNYGIWSKTVIPKEGMLIILYRCKILRKTFK